MIENVEAGGFRGVKDSHATQPCQTQFPVQAAADGVTHWPSLVKERARSARHRFERRPPLWRHARGLEIRVPCVCAVSLLERYIQSSAPPVDREILPEVRQLKGRAYRVRLLIEPLIIVTGDPKHEPAHRIGGSTAVVEQVDPCRVPRRHDILSKRAEKIVKERSGAAGACGSYARAPGK